MLGVGKMAALAAPRKRRSDDGKDDTSKDDRTIEFKYGKICDFHEGQQKQSDDQAGTFTDGVTVVDFVLTYEGHIEKDSEKRDKFINNCKRQGLEIEHQDRKESVDGKTHYWKIHGRYDRLLKGAEDLRFHKPIEKNKLTMAAHWEKTFKAIGRSDPLEPRVPTHLQKRSFFTAQFQYDKKDKFINYDDEKSFFSTAERGAIVYNILQTISYGEDHEDFGLSNLLHDEIFTAAFPLHESGCMLTKGQRLEDMSLRQFLYHSWCHKKSWFKWQPLNQIMMYFGVKVAMYFKWLEFYTLWLIPAAFVGLIVLLAGIVMKGPTESEVCNPELRYQFYQCPVCDTDCDFWYITDACFSARIGKIFDNGWTILFAIFMSFWAVLFLEFWKRQQYIMNFKWDVLGYESFEEVARPQFKRTIKQWISSSSKEEAKKYYCYNPVLDKKEHIQPLPLFYSKMSCSIGVISTMIVVTVITSTSIALYQQAIAKSIYSSLNVNVGSLVITLTSAVIQFIVAFTLSNVYNYIAQQLTKWELHRTQSEHYNNLTVKLYVFEFMNYYSSLFYIALIKGKLSGFPGSYTRINDDIRFTDCGSYDCLLDLTIYLFVFMMGRMIVGNISEIIVPIVWKIVNRLKNKEKSGMSRWEEDNNLAPSLDGSLFHEYLELVIQYGLVTIFVAALPIAPLLALISNLIEMRVDANKFLVLQRRVVAERAGSIGAWNNILAVVAHIAVIVNALFIAFSTNLPLLEVFKHEDHRSLNGSTSGFVNWTYGSFSVSKLLDGQAFPAFSSQHLPLYNGSEIVQENGENFLYLPYIDFACLNRLAKVPLPLRNFSNIIGLPEYQLTSGVHTTLREDYYKKLIENDRKMRNYILVANTANESPMREGKCFRGSVQCRFLTFATEGGPGQEQTNRVATYWKVLTARLAFVIIFEHIVFTISAIIAFLIPDMPNSVKNEIRRQQFLYNAVIVQKAQTKGHT